MFKPFIVRTLLVLGTVLFAQNAHSYPCGSVRIITPVGAGQTFATGQLIAHKLEGVLGVPVILESHPGAGGSLGVLAVINAAPDGCTVLYGIGSALVLPYFSGERPYDALRDLRPVDLMLEVAPSVLLGHSGGACSFAAFSNEVRTNPRGVDVGANNQTFAHLAKDMLLGLARLSAVHVPYKSEAAAVQDLLGGHIEHIAVLAPTALGVIRDGKACAIVQISNERNPFLKNIPSLHDVGLTGPDFRVFNGLLVPKKTPDTVVHELAEAAGVLKRDPDFVSRLVQEASQPIWSPNLTSWLREITPAYRAIAQKYATTPKE